MSHYNAQSTLPLQKSFVNGAALASTSGKRFETRHPGNDQVICEVETAGQAEVDGRALWLQRFTKKQTRTKENQTNSKGAA